MVSAWPLATFDHRLAMRFLRVYSHPTERVFDAVSTGAQLDAWMLPECRVERRMGGAWSMSFANPDPSKVVTGAILAWRPPFLVDYGGMRFELQGLSNGGCRLDFIQSFADGDQIEPRDGPGEDQPAGPTSPWRPGLLAGFHMMLDGLGRFLDGGPDPIPFIDGVHAYHRGAQSNDDLAMTALYREHIAEHCPAR